MHTDTHTTSLQNSLSLSEQRRHTAALLHLANKWCFVSCLVYLAIDGIKKKKFDLDVKSVLRVYGGATPESNI